MRKPPRRGWGTAIFLMAMHMTAACGTRSVRENPPPHPARRYVLEQAAHDRWLHAAQRPELTPFTHAGSTLYLDLPAADPRTGERAIRVSIGVPRIGDSLSLTVRADGDIVRHQTWFRQIPSAAIVLPGDSARLTRLRLLVGGRLMLPLARVWDLVPRVHPPRFVTGARWTDTLALATEYEGSRQTLAGVRVSTLLRDTIVAGRRLWIVRDSARVDYTERELQQERTLDTLVVVERSATGTVRGRYLYDRELGFLRARDDTTSLAGHAVLRYPDGRSFRSPARYERTREWTLYAPGAYSARQAALREERQRTSSGPVRSPSDETERRLASGDSALRDSLAGVWAGERDPDRREELYRLLQSWGPGGAEFRSVLESRRAVAGDSAFVLQQLARRAYPARPPIDVDAARQMIRVMADPGISFAFGVSRDAIYENLVQTLVTWPPAVTPDTSRWRCTPAACRLFGEQWRSAQEPRLRDVGLAALVTLDPTRWSDTALARAAQGSTVIVPVAQLANGVAARWPAAAKVPIPAPGADWRAWVAWASATDPRYRAPAMPPATYSPENRMLFEQSHVTAIRFYQMRTGRDVTGELRRQLAAAADDTARMVFGTMLTGLGDSPTADQVAAQFRSGSAPQIRQAGYSLPRLFGERAPPADSATTAAVLDRLIASSRDDVAPWPELIPRRDASTRPAAPTPGSPRSPLYVLADSVPPALRERWRARVRFVSLDAWRRMSERESATLLTLSSVERVGPFVRVRTHVSGRLSRLPNEVARLHFGGTTYYLLASGDGWVIVAEETWVT